MKNKSPVPQERLDQLKKVAKTKCGVSLFAVAQDTLNQRHEDVKDLIAHIEFLEKELQSPTK